MISLCKAWICSDVILRNEFTILAQIVESPVCTDKICLILVFSYALNTRVGICTNIVIICTITYTLRCQQYHHYRGSSYVDPGAIVYDLLRHTKCYRQAPLIPDTIGTYTVSYDAPDFAGNCNYNSAPSTSSNLHQFH